MAKKGYASLTIKEETDKLVVALAKKLQRSKAFVIQMCVEYYVQTHTEGGDTS